MDCTRNAWEMPGFSSVLTFTRTTSPLVASMVRSRMGPSVRHGPHHGAHRSTTTACVFDRSMTSVWKVASVTSMAMKARYRDTVRASMSDVPGIHTARVTEWLEAHVAGARGP